MESESTSGTSSRRRKIAAAAEFAFEASGTNVKMLPAWMLAKICANQSWFQGQQRTYHGGKDGEELGSRVSTRDDPQCADVEDEGDDEEADTLTGGVEGLRSER